MNAAMRRGRLSRVGRFWSMNFLCQPKDSRRTIRIVRTRISALVRFARIRTKRTACAQHFAPKKILPQLSTHATLSQHRDRVCAMFCIALSRARALQRCRARTRRVAMKHSRFHGLAIARASNPVSRRSVSHVARENTPMWCSPTIVRSSRLRFFNLTTTRTVAPVVGDSCVLRSQRDAHSPSRCPQCSCVARNVSRNSSG